MPPHTSIKICPECLRTFHGRSGLTQHRNSAHRPISPPPGSANSETGETFTYKYHGKATAEKSDFLGRTLPPFSPPPPTPMEPQQQKGDWAPFNDREEFDFAQYHFVKAQSSASSINAMLDWWAAVEMRATNGASSVPWTSAEDLYETIDMIQHGDAPWELVNFRYTGPLPPGTPPKWMTETYELSTRNSLTVFRHQLGSSAFKDGKMNYKPYRQFNGKGKRILSNLMSGNWVWKQADEICKDPLNEGCMVVPTVSGSDKTTVSVATGHQEYHPVYGSPGNLTNIARRGHGEAVLPLALLPIPKASKRHRKREDYQRFCRQLYHACLARVFAPLKPYMTTPDIVRCADGYYRRVVYTLGPYIADYPEQVWLSAIVQGWCPKCTSRPDNLDGLGARRRTQDKTDLLIKIFDPGTLWDDFGIRHDIIPFTDGFPRAEIYELISPDLLHQSIKGTFKDHLVEWVMEYLYETHPPKRALEIIEDIDHRVSAVPIFPGLRRFPDGRDFTQWTGDDSKCLMKVYLAAIAGYVPPEMLKAISRFLDFCYMARRNSLTAEDLDVMDTLLDEFHEHRQVFITTGVRESISLPRQHSLMHYVPSIYLFGAPNGLCSSITESKHIKAIKEPWRRSSRHNALGQMLQTISRLDKMLAAERRFADHGMTIGTTSFYRAMALAGTLPEAPPPDQENPEDGDDEGPSNGPAVIASVKLAATKARGYPRYLDKLAAHVNEPHLPEALQRFLWADHHPDSDESPANIPLIECPRIRSPISVYHSAVARYFSPSDTCGAGGMHQERIRSCPAWRGKKPRYDTVFVTVDEEQPGMEGMEIARTRLLFSFAHGDKEYSCALVEWFVCRGDEPDPDVVSRGSGKPRRHSAILITIIWVVLTIHTALRWSYIDFVFVQNGSSRETELIAYSLTMLPRDVTSFITLFLSILLADATMIWRCWMLYGRRWTVIVLPVLSLAGGTVAHISRGVAAFGRHGLEADSVEPKWQIVFLSTTVFTNVFCTVSIIFRVVSISGWSKSLKTYHGLLEILIESAIMYTSIYIIQIALYIHGAYFQDEWDTRFFYAQALANVITGVAPTLIIARVALGHARPDDSWTRTSLPHLRTTMRSVAESMRFARHGTGTATEVDLERNENSQASWEVERIQASSNTRIEPKEKPQLVV